MPVKPTLEDLLTTLVLNQEKLATREDVREVKGMVTTLSGDLQAHRLEDARVQTDQGGRLARLEEDVKHAEATLEDTGEHLVLQQRVVEAEAEKRTALDRLHAHPKNGQQFRTVVVRAVAAVIIAALAAYGGWQGHAAARPTEPAQHP